METSNKKAVLAYIRNNPGCTATAVANEVFGKWRWSGWIFARNDIGVLWACDILADKFRQKYHEEP